MKVNLAAQTLSSSIADALEFLCIDMELEEFKDVKPTVKFIRTFDKLFDILNSRNPWGKNMKAPLRPENETSWKPFITESINYILSCKNMNGNLLCSTVRKVPFIGFAVSAISLLNIFNEQVLENKTLNYVLTYKFSQDHLELFFCSIRSRNGWNNNPNCLQFMHTYKRLLMHQTTKNDTGNCIAQDQTQILTISNTDVPLNITDVNLNKIFEERGAKQLEKKIDIFLPINLSEFAENIIAYISGFIIRVVERKIKCPVCLEALRFTEDYDYADRELKLINRKSNGGLLLPSKSSRDVCKVVEKKIQIVWKVERQIPQKSILINLLLRQVDSLTLNDNIFAVLNDHMYDSNIFESLHKKTLILEIVKEYSSIRIHSLANQINETISGEKIRKKLNKLILFKHQ